MNKFLLNKFLVLGMKTFRILALSVAILNVNSACFAILHQPEIPKSLERYKK